MMKSMSAFLVAVTCAVAAPAQTQAEKDPKLAAVKKKAQEIGEALKKQDYAKVVDLTYPKAIELMGGREKAISAIEAEMRQLKETGLSLVSLKIGEPAELLAEGKNTFAILPTTTEMSATGGKILIASYFLGISPDEGKTWTFIDGNGLSTAEKRKQVLPKLPEELELPEPQEPRFIKDE
jgi:hypothetical protein